MKKIIINTEFQDFRKACLSSDLDKEILIEYNNNQLIYNFNYSSKLRKIYKYHAKKEEGAMTAIDSEIHGIYNAMTKGGIPTRVGDLEVFNMAHDYKIEYLGDDNMMGMKNVKIKSLGRTINNCSYVVECEDCGRKTFSSVKEGCIPKCPRCAKKAGEKPYIKMSDLLSETSLINRDPVNRNELSFYNENKDNGFLIKLTLDNSQSECLNEMQMGVRLGEGIKKMYDLSIKDIDKYKKAEDKLPASEIKSAPIKKSTSTRKAKSKITDEDLTYVLNKIRTNFANKSFKSRDLAPSVVDRLTARQLPSRLTQLVNKGILNADNASPKNYTLIQEV